MGLVESQGEGQTTSLCASLLSFAAVPFLAFLRPLRPEGLEVRASTNRRRLRPRGGPPLAQLPVNAHGFGELIAQRFAQLRAFTAKRLEKNSLVGLIVKRDLGRVTETISCLADGQIGQGTRPRACCVFTETNVCHKVCVRHNADASPGPDRILPRIIPRVRPRTLRDRIQLLNPMPSCVPVAKQFLHARGSEFPPGPQVHVHVAPRPCPRRPAPHVSITGEIVRIRAWPVDEKIAPADVHDAVTIPIMTEQRLAKTEKTRARLTIILEHDGFRYSREDPIKARNDAISTTHVVLAEIPLDLAGPIDTFNDVARLGAQRGIPRTARAIGNDEQLRWPRLPNALKHSRRQVGASEYEKCHGSVHSSGDKSRQKDEFSSFSAQGNTSTVFHAQEI